MFNVRDIVRNNNATFYDFDTRKSRSQGPRVAIFCLVSIVAALTCPKVSDDLLAGVLAVQSILLGFTVNVMFFLLGNREKETPEGTSIEAKLRSKRLRDLYHELFYNVSYFNLIAVTSIIVATGLLLPTPEVLGFLRGLQAVEAYVNWLETSKCPQWLAPSFAAVQCSHFTLSRLSHFHHRACDRSNVLLFRAEDG